MKVLEERILKDGQNLGDGILKVDGFINHQVDPELMYNCGKELAHRFMASRATCILTAEISGIAPAIMAGAFLKIPVIYARKHKPITMSEQAFLTLAPSHTKGRNVELIVSAEYLTKDQKVLIIDDFLASGATILGLVRLVEVAGAELVGIGTLVEKCFEQGRESLNHLNVPIVALARIESMTDSEINFLRE